MLYSIERFQNMNPSSERTTESISCLFFAKSFSTSTGDSTNVGVFVASEYIDPLLLTSDILLKNVFTESNADGDLYASVLSAGSMESLDGDSLDGESQAVLFDI